MFPCPDCGHENIDGEDFCEKCQQPLGSGSRPRPSSSLERSIVRDAIRRLVPREPLLIDPATTVNEALRRLVDRRIGCAIVVSGHRVVGIFTERDAVARIDFDRPDWASRPVAEVMTQSVETLELDDRIAFALQKMDIGGYRHIPILRKGRVTGVVSVRHILEYVTAAL
jgi:CBS domain-containing protein